MCARMSEVFYHLGYINGGFFYTYHTRSPLWREVMRRVIGSHRPYLNFLLSWSLIGIKDILMKCFHGVKSPWWHTAVSLRFYLRAFN